MAIYGERNTNTTILTEEELLIIEKQDLDAYIDDLFLETCINESVASIQKAINDLANKDNVTQDDINKIYNDIRFEEDKSLKVKKAALFVSQCITNLISAVDILKLFGAPVPEFTRTKKYSKAIFIASTLLSVFNILLKNDINVDSYYRKLLTVESRAIAAQRRLEKELQKASKNGDNDKIKEIETSLKRLDKIIKIANDIKVARREQLAKTNAANYHESTDILNEFSGNDIKNARFESVIADIDRLCKYNMDRIDNVYSTLTKIQSVLKSKSSSNKARTIINLSDKLEIQLKRTTDVYAPLAFKLLKQESRSLNNMLSSTGLETKKKLKSKLDSYLDLIDTKLEKIEDMESTMRDLVSDNLGTNEIAREIQQSISTCEGIYRTELNLTRRDILKIYKLLRIEKQENSMLYKLMNK